MRGEPGEVAMTAVCWKFVKTAKGRQYAKITLHIVLALGLVLPQSGSELWFEPEPFRTELMVRSQVRPRPRTGPL